MPQRSDPTADRTPATDVPPATTVREILDEARRVAGSGSRLAARLEQLGIGPPDTNRYSDSAISNWIRGRTMPPADVLVAATIIAGQPLAWPRRLAEPSVVQSLEEGVARQRYEIDALHAAVIDLYGRLGYPMPNLDTPADTRAPSRTAASAG
jgi:hypothetical protein